jgi:Tfp pilus assembly protein PilW
MKLHKGISLLEMVLVVAIGAAVIMGAAHFYWRAKDRSAVLRATSLIQRVIQASDEWKTAQRVSDMSVYSDNVINELIDTRLLQADDSHNPWGGLVAVSGDSSTGALIVRLESVPDSACQLLISRFRTTATEGNFACNGKEGGETWEGHFE